MSPSTIKLESLNIYFSHSPLLLSQVENANKNPNGQVSFRHHFAHYFMQYQGPKPKLYTTFETQYFEDKKILSEFTWVLLALKRLATLALDVI
jgi:hypothetical protein